jgi:hypothetical protein
MTKLFFLPSYLHTIDWLTCILTRRDTKDLLASLSHLSMTQHTASDNNELILNIEQYVNNLWSVTHFCAAIFLH